MNNPVEIVDRDAVPTIGYWQRGSIIVNNAYAAGEPLFWMCTASGEPGTWGAAYDSTSLASVITNTAAAGAVNGATVSAAEYGDGVVHKTVLTLAATPLTVTDALAYAGVKVYDFPEGRLHVLGVTASLQWAVTSARVSTINDSASLTWGLGTATASNATLATTMVDLLPKTTKVLAAAAAALNTASTAALAAAAQFDGTGTASDAFLNAAFETGTDIDADGTMTATGTITITWINLGDY